MTYTFEKEGVKAKEPRRAQYFEVEGNKGIYYEGWFASQRVIVPWRFSWHENGGGKVESAWELYNLDNDFSQSIDLAKSMPGKLEEMQKRWWAEAGKNHVLPIISSAELMEMRLKESASAPKKYTFYPGLDGLSSHWAPPLTGRSFSIVAKIAPKIGIPEGVIFTNGGRFGGYSLFIKDRKVFYVSNWYGRKVNEIVSRNEIPEGDFTLTIKVKCEKRGCDQARGEIFIDGKSSGDGEIDHLNQSSWEGFDIGLDRGTPVGDEYYESPFKFTGSLKRVEVSLD